MMKSGNSRSGTNKVSSLLGVDRTELGPCPCARCRFLRAALRGEKLLASENANKFEKIKKISTTPALLHVLAASGVHSAGKALLFAAAVSWPLVLLPKADEPQGSVAGTPETAAATE